MVVRREVCLKSGVQEQSPEVSPVVENDSLEVGDEHWVYEPSVGDEMVMVMDGGDEVHVCVHACDGRSEDQKMYSHSNTTRLYSPKDCKEWVSKL